MANLRIPKFHAPAAKPGRKSKEEIKAVAKRMGRPPNAVKAKLEELNARLVLSENADRVMEMALKAALDPEHPAHVTMLKAMVDRLANMEHYQGTTKVPTTLSITISDAEGNVTEVKSSTGSDTEDNTTEDNAHVIDMGDAEVVPNEP